MECEHEWQYVVETMQTERYSAEIERWILFEGEDNEVDILVEGSTGQPDKYSEFMKEYLQCRNCDTKAKIGEAEWK